MIALLLGILTTAVTADTDTSTVTQSLDSSVVVSSLPLPGRGNTYIYTPSKAANIISVIGEPDVMRQLATLPGVASGVEGSLGLYIRGGNAGTGRTDVDGVPVYNASHALGLFSSLPSEMFSVIKAGFGGFSSADGNFSSGTVSISSCKNILEKAGGSISVSPYMIGGYAEIPGVTDLRISARYSPVPHIARIASRMTGHFDDIGGSIYDLSASAVRRTGSGKLSAFMFFSNDNIDISSDNSVNSVAWRTWMGKIGWERQAGDRGRIALLTYCSGSASEEGQDGIGIISSMNEAAVKGTYRYECPDGKSMSVGAEAKYMTGGYNMSVFAAGKARIAGIADVTAGYRHTVMLTGGGTFSNGDIHLLADIDLSDGVGAEVSYDRNVQYFHTLEGLQTGWALNIQVPMSHDFPEEVSRQAYAGLYGRWNIGRWAVHANLGAYIKRMENLVSYTSSLNMFRNISDTWRYDACRGKGRAGGIEATVSLRGTRLSVNSSYTYSRATRTYSLINGGREFPFKFSKPHTFNLESDCTLGSGRISKHLLLCVNYSSGHLVTAAVRQYEGVPLPYWSDLTSYPAEFINNIYNRVEMTGVNAVRMRPYFRVDAGYSMKIPFRKCTHELTFSVYNIFNRHNPYIYYHDLENWKQVSIMPVMPSLRWKIIF